MTGWVLTQGLSFKGQSCYLLVCSSKHIGEGRKSVLRKPKASFPTADVWANLSSKAMEDATLDGRVLIPRDAPTVTEAKVEMRYQKTLPSSMNI